MSSGIEEAKLRVRISEELFADRLRYFVERWAPGSINGEIGHRFREDLIRLMVEAMRHQTATMSYGIETYASSRFQEISMRPLTVIMERPKPDEPKEFK